MIIQKEAKNLHVHPAVAKSKGVLYKVSVATGLVIWTLCALVVGAILAVTTVAALCYVEIRDWWQSSGE